MTTDRDIINRLGGDTVVAKLCNNAITPQAVHGWKMRNRIPPGWRLYLHSKYPDAFIDTPAGGAYG